MNNSNEKFYNENEINQNIFDIIIKTHNFHTTDLGRLVRKIDSNINDIEKTKELVKNSRFSYEIIDSMLYRTKYDKVFRDIVKSSDYGLEKLFNCNTVEVDEKMNNRYISLEEGKENLEDYLNFIEDILLHSQIMSMTSISNIINESYDNEEDKIISEKIIKYHNEKFGKMFEFVITNFEFARLFNIECSDYYYNNIIINKNTLLVLYFIYGMNKDASYWNNFKNIYKEFKIKFVDAIENKSEIYITSSKLRQREYGLIDENIELLFIDNPINDIIKDYIKILLDYKKLSLFKTYVNRIASINVVYLDLLNTIKFENKYKNKFIINLYINELNK